jgi:hypothetical protein
MRLASLRLKMSRASVLGPGHRKRDHQANQQAQPQRGEDHPQLMPPGVGTADQVADVRRIVMQGPSPAP